MAIPFGNRRVTRRQFLQYAEVLSFSTLLAACAQSTAPAAPAAAPAAQAGAAAPAEGVTAAGGIKEIARNETFIAVRGGTQGKFTEWDQWNPFVPVANHQFGSNLIYEPLAFYSAFADKEYMWLAESYKYSDDFKELTIKTRQGIKWSDGKDFTADDVTFTLNACKEYGAKIRWGTNIAQVMDKAETVDQQTVKVTLTVPAPRFFWLLTYHFDIGVYILPKHIFEGKDLSTFSHFDLANGLPVTTSPWRVVHSSPQQKILDRADDWWGVAAGVAQLPAVKRFILLPDQGEQQLIQSVIKNEVDFTTGIQPSSFPTVFNGNPKATSWTGQEAPFGYVDWWPHSLYVNNEVAPWSDKNVRWALSYYIDRSKIVDIAWSGASQATPLPMPSYPPLQPYFDATKPLLEKYNTLEYDPKKGDDLLTAKGWKKNDAGMWVDETGKPVKLDIVSFFDFTSVGPVLVEMLKRGGIDASYSEPPDFFDNFSTGKFTGCLFGHGGSCREPQETMALYQSTSEAIPGGHAVNFSRWKNPDFDKLADQAYTTAPTDTQKLVDIWVKGMEIWLPELPDIQLTQGFHRLPWTTENWTNMPDAKNPYTNSAQWHLTFSLVLHNVKPSA
ncbi:MAG: ABC transporter substrate-binding protein [Chloroflexi bacterium]|nr:ABC transporter substrate-binding protein [Chloroflexota bacterium]